MTCRKFIDTLAAIPNFSGDKERQVEQAYNAMFKESFPGITISNPYKCDGYFESDIGGKRTGVILEYKYDLDFSKKSIRSQVLAQVMFYLKKFERDGRAFPTVVFVGDVNECFVIHSNYLLKFLSIEGVDWDVAPSAAHTQIELVAALANDDTRNAFVFDVDSGFEWESVRNQIVDCATNIARHVHVTEHNIDKVFSFFKDKVLKKSALSPNDMVGVFLGCITDADNYYLHPKRANFLMTPNNGSIKVDGEWFKAFMQRFDTNTTPMEKKRLVAICDRLIEDENRRKTGAFYTPTPWVDYAHGRMAKVLGENWKDEYVVWDAAAGTKNLTRDYVFRELYCSTLEQAELDISEKYNPPKDRSFQFDFLNDELKRQSQGGKVPNGLMDALEGGKKVVFLINPPYATAGENSTEKGKQKAGIAQTMVNKQMKEAKVGRCSENLLAQFLYRIMTIKMQYEANVSIGLFCNPIYLSGSTYAKFREKFLKEFKYEDGFLFNAGHFSDVSANWGIDFTIWTSGETADKNNFGHDLIDTNENGDIVKVGEKDIYNSDKCEKVSDWIRVKNVPSNKEAICLSSGIKPIDKIELMPNGSIGYVFTGGYNSVYGNTQFTGLFTSFFSNGHGVSILPSNFLRCTSAFTARKLIENSWINQKDEYLAPDMMNQKYRQFEVDSIVYSLFHSSSQQSSLRDISYKGKKWDIPNQFFWMSHDEIANLANDAGLEETYNQASVAPKETFVYEQLKSVYADLSDESRAALEKASELVRKTMKLRRIFDDEHPEYQIMNWDCGWYQIKALLKQYLPDELNEFRELYRKLGDRMRPLVYELGFLRK